MYITCSLSNIHFFLEICVQKLCTLHVVYQTKDACNMFVIPFHVRKYHLLSETDEKDKNVCNRNRKKTTPGPKSKFFDEETAAHAIETTLEKDRLTCVRNSVKHANREELTRPFGFFSRSQ